MRLWTQSAQLGLLGDWRIQLSSALLALPRLAFMPVEAHEQLRLLLCPMIGHGLVGDLVCSE